MPTKENSKRLFMTMPICLQLFHLTYLMASDSDYKNKNG